MTLLGPLPAGNELERLREAGQVRPAQGDLNDLPDPLPLDAGRQAPSQVLARLRRGER
ncbi:hypothetical protein BH24ACT13_BH24ACT13_13750 [soil metagenome]|jgi:hypothetical protein